MVSIVFAVLDSFIEVVTIYIVIPVVILTNIILFFAIQYYLVKLYINIITMVRTETPKIWAFVVEQFTHKKEVTNIVKGEKTD